MTNIESFSLYITYQAAKNGTQEAHSSINSINQFMNKVFIDFDRDIQMFIKQRAVFFPPSPGNLNGQVKTLAYN